MSSKSKPLSPVVSFIQCVWDNAYSGKGHSWQILNGALHQALMTAITSHFKFMPDDFRNVAAKFQGSYWMGTDGDGKDYGQRYYAHAVACDNMSACQSFEHWRGMEPYLFLGKRLCVGGWHGTSDVGLLVIDPQWRDVKPGTITRYVSDAQLLESLEHSKIGKWWVTGFDNKTIRLASYYSAKNPLGRREGKPTKLLKLSRSDLAEMSKVLRAGMRPVKEKKGKETE